jgi:iron complex transport system ATP-binding protein
MNSMLHTNNLAIGFRQGKKSSILHEHIELSVRPGELICLIGPNGAGKSTLLRTLAGIHPLIEGSVFLNNRNISQYNAKELARTVGLVLTERNFGAIRVFDLVSLGRYPYTGFFARLTNDDHRIVLEVLAETGLTQFRKKIFNKLSDGEKQKVMIARVLAQQTPLIILDEPTAFLDLPAKFEIFKMLSVLAHENNKAVLVTTHDLELALKFADKIWLLEQGKDFTCGAPEDLVINDIFSRYFTASNFRFNQHTGSFESTGINYKHVNLNGKGFETFWMAKALQRKGYKVSHEPCEIAVTILGTNRYTVRKNGRTIDTTSIENLLLALETM